MFGYSETTVAMNIKIKQAAALVLFGIAIGCAMSYVYFAAFLSDRANDGMPIAMGGHLYRVTDVSQSPVNTTINLTALRVPSAPVNSGGIGI